MIQPSTFDTYGTAGHNQIPSSVFPQADNDGKAQANPGLVGWVNSNYNAYGYTYGNNGLNGDGSGNVVTDPLQHYVDMPAGTLYAMPANGPSVQRFTAPTTGTYTLTTTFTDPYFDPFDGPGGAGFRGDDAWTFNDGQAQYEVIDSFNNPNDGALNGTTSVLASASPGEITSLTGVSRTQAPTSGNPNAAYSYSSAPGSFFTTTGASLTSAPSGGINVSSSGTGVQNNSNGTGGSWTVTNMGPMDPGGPGLSNLQGDNTNKNDNTDPTGDQYNMTWTYTTTVTLSAGDHVDFVANPTWTSNSYTSLSGDDTAPVYLTANFSTTSSVAAPTVATSGSTGQHYSTSGSPVTVDSGLTVSSSNTAITGASMQITNFQSGDTLHYSTTDGVDGSYNSATGLLQFTGGYTPAQYQAALRTVTFSTTSATTGTRTIAVTGNDNQPGSTVDDSVVVGTISSPAHRR